MKRVYDFLKEAGTYYLATVEGDVPHVRPFGTILMYENRLYIQTGRSKAVSRQIAQDPHVEICAFKDGKWLRVAASLKEDERIEVQQAMLDDYPSLKAMYAPCDGNTQVFYLTDAVATFSSFTEAPVTVEF